MKKYFFKKLVMTTEDGEYFENSTNVNSVIMLMLMVMLK